MKALVIGGTGPVGPYVIEGLLKRGYQLTIFHRGTHETDLPLDVEHIHGDPHFLETLEQALGKRSFDLVIATYGRLRFTAQVLRGRTPRFISVGGVGVYKGWINFDPSVRTPIPTSEDTPLQTGQQRDKFSYRMVEAESVVMEAHRERHYDATHFRLPMVYGPRQVAPREWSIVRRILDKRSRLILPDGGLSIHSRGYAQNIAYALLLAVDKPKESAGQIYNARDETLFSLRDWIDIISQAMNYRFEFVEMPYSLARPARVYSAEDRLINEFVKVSRQIKELAPPKLGFRHPYAHPKYPGEGV